MHPENPYTPPSTTEPPPSYQTDAQTALTLKQILFSFNGRIPRRVLWTWGVISAVAFILPLALLAPILDTEGASQVVAIIVLIPLGIIYFWVSLALRVKRWHDHDKSGFWIFIGMIPYIGALISFVLLGCLRGTTGHNRYGPDPF